MFHTFLMCLFCAEKTRVSFVVLVNVLNVCPSHGIILLLYMQYNMSLIAKHRSQRTIKTPPY